MLRKRALRIIIKKKQHSTHSTHTHSGELEHGESTAPDRKVFERADTSGEARDRAQETAPRQPQDTAAEHGHHRKNDALDEEDTKHVSNPALSESDQLYARPENEKLRSPATTACHLARDRTNFGLCPRFGSVCVCAFWFPVPSLFSAGRFVEKRPAS